MNKSKHDPSQIVKVVTVRLELLEYWQIDKQLFQYSREIHTNNLQVKFINLHKPQRIPGVPKCATSLKPSITYNKSTYLHLTTVLTNMVLQCCKWSTLVQLMSTWQTYSNDRQISDQIIIDSMCIIWYWDDISPNIIVFPSI